MESIIPYFPVHDIYSFKAIRSDYSTVRTCTLFCTSENYSAITYIFAAHGEKKGREKKREGSFTLTGFTIGLTVNRRSPVFPFYFPRAATVCYRYKYLNRLK